MNFCEYLPLTVAETAKEAARIQAQLQDTGRADISGGFLNRCQFDDCLRLLNSLSFPSLRLCVPLEPSGGDLYLTVD